MGRLMLWCAVLLCLVTRATAKTSYVLSSPASMISEDSAKVCLNIVGSIEPLDVSVMLEHNRQNISLIAEDVQPPKYFQCGEFKVPSVTEAVPVALIFTATGANTSLRERKTVVINSANENCMYQLDKPMYKPNQKVFFRFMCLNPQLKLVTPKVTSIYLQDPSRAKIAQWLLPKADHGVISLDFQLIKDATLGSYVITAERESGYPIRQYFTVEPYVLPRFSVDVNVPFTVSVTAEAIKFNVSAITSYGEPVAGSVTVRYCKQPSYYGRRQNCFKDKEGSCANMVGELDEEGTYSGIIDMYSSFMRSARGASLTLDITVTEAGTEIQATESRYVSVTSQPARLGFDYESLMPYYKRGVIYRVVATLSDEIGQPMPNQEIEVQVNNDQPQTAITDSEGRIEHGIDTTGMVEANFTVKVSYTNPDQCYYAEWSEKDFPSAEYTVSRFYSTSGNFLQIRRPKGELSCGQSHGIDVQYILSTSQELTSAEDNSNSMTMYYMVLSKSAIVHSGQKDLDPRAARNDTLTLDLPVSYEMAPRADFIAYMVLENEVISDTISLNIEKCFKNQVSMTFSEDQGLPGSKVDVQLSADPNSYCALRVIDSSLLILNPYEQFSAEGVYNARRYYTYGYNVGGFDVEDPAPACEDPDKISFFMGRYYKPVSSASEGDTYGNIKAIGLLMGTDLITRKPEVCDNNPPPPRIAPLAGGAGGFGGGGGVNLKFASLEMDSAASSGASAVSTVRTNFSETFLWVMVPLDTEGRATLSKDAPDTITKWLGSAFCTSEETGFGMTRYSANYTTYLPFFLELSLPYSFIRGETLVVNAVVRNYMPQCVKVKVTMENSNAYNAVLKEGKQGECVCANSRATYTWNVDANTIGEISFKVSAQTTHIGQSCDGPNDPSQSPRQDTVVQSTIVEPEGVYKELTSSNLVFLKDNNIQLPISITPPKNVVPDSAKAYVTSVSDFIGLPLRYLEDLVQKPSGCGEQVLARMAYIPHILKYLNATGKLDDKILQKAKGYLLEGYYRLLAFSSGGGYRVFANSEEQPNAFLTAYAFRTIETIQELVFVDKERQQQTLIWLENTQNLETGCFKSQGTLFTIQGADNDLYFTAYVAAALLESNYDLGNTMLTGALDCLKNASKSEQKLPEQALMLYAFSLANLPEYREPLLQSLMKKAVREGMLLHWEREDMPKRPVMPFFGPPYAPAEVLITSYMLLSFAASPSVSQEDMTKMAEMGMWLAQQQSSHGGFGSTQDSALGLQALSTFAKMLNAPPDSRQTVVVRRGNGEVGTINMDKDNSLVVHRTSLPEAKGDYSIDVSGTGWCMIQTTVGYNVPVPEENSAYSLSLFTSSESCINGVAYGFTVNGSVSYRGTHEVSGMAIISIRLLSGYRVDYSSISKMTEVKGISKVDDDPKGELIIYLKEVSKEPINFSFKLLMGQRVLNVRTGSALVYSYYEQDENGYATYEHPCAGPSEAFSREHDLPPSGSTKG